LNALGTLDASGNNPTKTTSLRWAYPALNAPTLGPITATPTLEFGRLYFGTLRNLESSDPDERIGRFFALNPNNGAEVWRRSGFSYENSSGTTISEDFDDFLGSPITVPATVLNDVVRLSAPPLVDPIVMPNTVYAMNQNRFVFAFDAATGTTLWQSNELGTGP
jgi:outer membrane protein assembly factor BamB